jgi:hypothetical protein
MKQLNNKLLVGILVVFAAIFIFIKVFRAPGRESNMSNVFPAIDTAAITRITIFPVLENKQEIKLSRENGSWKAAKESITATASVYTVKELLQSISSIQVQQLVTKKRESWSNYGVSDSTGTHLQLYKGDEQVADWWIGQGADGNSSFIRAAGEDKVYATERSLGHTINRPFNDWRDKTFLRIKSDQLNTVEFQYPADSSFTLIKKEKKWMIGSDPADSAAVEAFLAKQAFQNMANFIDNFSPDSREADMVIRFKKDNILYASVSAWKRENDWVLTSSYQKGVYFSSEGSTIINDLFPGKRKLVSTQSM